MDTLAIGTALLAWRGELYDPFKLIDEDLRALYEHKRSLQPRRARPSLGSIGRELGLGFRHFRAALRLALSRLATS